MKRLWVVLLVVGGMVAAEGVAVADAEAAKVLVYSGTTGWRHEGNSQAISPASVNVIRTALEDADIETDYADCNGAGTGAGQCQNPNANPTWFTPGNLEQYDAIFLFNTSSNPGNPLWNTAQREAIQGFVQDGKGIAGNHNAVDMGGGQMSWAWWDAPGPDSAVGTLMPGHAATDINNIATVQVSDRNHLSTRDLPHTWQFGDEHYNFGVNVRGSHHVLMTLDETTYNPGGNAMGSDHPISWCRMYDGGRIWLTALGHFEASYLAGGGNNDFIKHLVGGTRWAAGEGNDTDCGGTVWNNYERTVLSTDMRGAIGLKIAADGKVYWTEIGADQGMNTISRLKMFDPETDETITVGLLETFADGTPSEDGVSGLEFDPDFANNNHIYIFYSPRQPVPASNGYVVGYQLVSRFTLNEDGTAIEPGSEQEIIRIEKSKVALNNNDGMVDGHPAHVAGSLAFASNGDLFIGTGDDVHPHASTNGYAPLDQRFPERYDARNTSANTNDLRGKILRITPIPDAEGTAEEGTTYEIPDGNMFAPGTPLTKPEIYAMGFRNPFTMHPDPENPEVVVVGEYGPDNGNNSANRGPAGIIEWNLVKEPGFFGWPFCTGDNSTANTYFRWTFPGTSTGSRYDCSLASIPAEVQAHATNQGMTNIPGPAVPATIWKKYILGDIPSHFGPMGGGQMSPGTGPIYSYDPSSQSQTRFPAYYDRSWFVINRGGNTFTKELRLDDDYNLVKVNEFLPLAGPTQAGNNFTIATAFGPDGSLYGARWTTDCCRQQSELTGQHLFKIDFTANDCLTDDEDPVPNATFSGIANPGGPGFVNSATMTATATDLGCSGIDTIEYSTAGDGGPWTGYSSPVTFNTPGENTVWVRATDHFGNTSDPEPFEYTIVAVEDTTPPVASAQLTGEQDDSDNYVGAARLTLSAVDDLSDILRIEYRVGGDPGTWQTYTAPVDFDQPGTYEVEYRATDSSVLENTSEPETLNFRVVGACTYEWTDDFSGFALDPKWDFQHPTTFPSGYGSPTVADGSLSMAAPKGDILGSDNSGPISFVGQPLPPGTNWTVTLKMTFEPTGGWQNAGLMLYQSDGNFIKAVKVHNNNNPGVTFFEIGADMPTDQRRDANTGSGSNPTTNWIRFTRNGDAVTADYSLNGTSWTAFNVPGGTPATLSLATSPRRDGPEVRIGPMAVGNVDSGASEIDPLAHFDWIRLEGEEATVCPDTEPPVSSLTLDPPAPDGNEGWYVTAPTATITATDNSTPDEEIDTEWRLGAGGAFQPYMAPLEITTQGSGLALQYRSTDSDGNTELTQEQLLNIDTVAPEVSHALDPAAGPYIDPASVEVTLNATDETSGVGSIEYDQGTGWTDYDPGDKPRISGIGTHTVEYRATDNAGNTSQQDSFNVTISDSTVTPPPLRPARLAAKAKKRVKLRGNRKAVKVKVNIRNTGGMVARGVRVCAKAPKKKVKVKKCANFGNIQPGRGKAKNIRIRAKKNFTKGKAKVRFTTQARGGIKRVRANVTVRRTK